MSRVFSIPAGRSAKYVVFAVWVLFVAGLIAANVPGKFTDAEKNEQTDYLPGDAESTKALEVTERLDDGDIAQTVIVYRHDGGLTAEDRELIERDRASLDQF